MKRVDKWETNLKCTIDVHRDLPSSYGISDCFQICNDAVKAVTGEFLFDEIYYSTKEGAAKQLLRRGFADVEQAFASKLETVPPALAQRGDIGVTESNGEICGGVFTSLGFMVRDDYGIQYLPISNVKTAFKVGR